MPITLSPPLLLTSSTAVQEQVDVSHRRIPVYVRLVPRDIWLRMHVDLHSTMGSVKDAVLERANVPLDDPSLVRVSGGGGGGAAAAAAATATPLVETPNEGLPLDALPRAFVARRAGLVAASIAPPKAAERTTQQQQQQQLGLWDATQSLDRASARDRAKAAAAAVAANVILGGDAGKGGPGKLGSLGSGMPTMLAATTSVGLPSPAEAARKSFNAAKLLAAQHRTAKPMTSFSALGAASRTAQRTTASAPPQQQPTTPTPITERTGEAGMDAYLDYLEYGLPGNAEAKRLEAEALARALGTNSLASNTPKLSPHSSNDGASFDVATAAATATNPAANTKQRAARPRAARLDPFDSDEEAGGGSTSEEESLWSVVEDEAEASRAYPLDITSTTHGTATSAILEVESSPSLSSEAADEALLLRTHDDEALWGTQLEEANQRRAKEAAAAAAMAQANAQNVTPVMHSRGTMARRESDASMGQSSERGRSGTITAASAAAARTQTTTQQRLADAPPSSLPATTTRMTRMGSEEVNPPHASTSSLSSSLSAPTASGSVEGGGSPAQSHASPVRQLSSLRSGGGRLAGIRLDEISAWDTARHPHSARYAVYSFANGHLMEDWRTVAAFHVRPFELLEVHYARHADRVHLPRLGEAATELKPDASGAAAGGAAEAALRHQRDTSRAGNPALDERYVEPFSEGWYYVLKPGSGSGKAQKAGLCMWKLRWVVIRGWRLSIFRQRPKQSVLAQANGVSSWALNTIKWIVTERADGMTNPPLGGASLANDSVSISFTSNVVSDYSLDEADFAGYNIVSLRALTEFDHRALFNILARAYWRHGTHGDATVGLEVEAWRRRAIVRATIAGRGGTVQPYRAGRKAGRNALARARLRPRGLSRSFDDADRWSSESEEEIFSPSAAFDHHARASAASTGESSLSSGTNYSANEQSAVRMSALVSAPQTPSQSGPSAAAGKRTRLDSSTGGVTTLSVSPSERSLHLRSSANSSVGGTSSPVRASASASAGGTLSSPSSTYNLARSRGFSLSRSARMATPSPESGSMSMGLSNLSLSSAASASLSATGVGAGQGKWRNSSGVSPSGSTPRAKSNTAAAASSVGALSTPESATHSDALLQPHFGGGELKRLSGSFGRARAHTVSAARPMSSSSRGSASGDTLPPLPAAQALSGKASGLFKGLRKTRS